MNYWLLLDRQQAPAMSAFMPYLHESEFKHAQRLRSLALQQRYIIGRAVVRQQLAVQLHCSPLDIELAYNPYQKPLVKNHNHCFFSISHSQQYTAVAFSSTVIGVDIEHIAPTIDPALLDVMLTTHERPHVQSATDFYAYWCAKEAILKAHGTGFLTNPLQLHLHNHQDWTFQAELANQNFYAQCALPVTGLMSCVASPLPLPDLPPQGWEVLTFSLPKVIH